MSRSCSATNSSSPPPPGDPGVETEFEAAEVLASLSTSTARGSSGGAAGESVDGCGGRRLSVRVKSESSPVDSALNSAVAEEEAKEKKPAALSFDLNVDQAVTLEQEEQCEREREELIKAESTTLAEPCRSPTPSHAGGKSRQNLTEAEKEARKLRRVLANRESARQTIRRRQALYEELTRKVADLVWENENLKRQKESALKEYQDLQFTNKNLNEQISKKLGSMVEENHGKFASANLPFASYPYIICKETPFVWPFSVPLGHSGVPHQLDVSLSATGDSNCVDKGKLSSTSGPSGHWCMVPCPLFVPVPDVKDGPNLIPFFPARDKQSETYVDNQRAGSSSSRTVTCVKAEVCTSEDKLGKLSADVVDQQLRCCYGRSQFDVKEAVGVKLNDSPSAEAAMNHGKRVVDSVAAAEARKRRRELTRLKSLHCRTSRKAGF